MPSLSSPPRPTLNRPRSGPGPAQTAPRPVALIPNPDTTPVENHAGLTALVMLDLGIFEVPLSLAHTGQPRTSPLPIGSVLVGDPQIGAAVAPPRLVHRDALADAHASASVYMLSLTGRNIGPGPVTWFAGVEISHLGNIAKRAAISLSTTGGETWSHALPLKDIHNSAFCLLRPLAPAESQDLLLRVSLPPLEGTNGSAKALGLTVDTTVVQTGDPRPRRAPRWRRPWPFHAQPCRTNAPRLSDR